MNTVKSTPPEIWTNIFSFCPTRNYTLVSHTWRAIAYAAPSLWTTITLPSHSVHPHHLPCFTRHLRLSGLLPVHVHISFPVGYEYEAIKPFAQALNEHVDRLQELEIRAEAPHAVGPFLNDTFFLTSTHSIFAPRLSDLSIYVHEDTDLGILEHLHPCSILANTLAFPSLASLSIPGFFTFLPMPTTDFRSLRTLRIDGSWNENGVPFYEIIRLLHHTPHLEVLYYKNQDQFSYTAGLTDGRTITSYAPPGMFVEKPVNLPIPLLNLREAEVTAPGSAMDLLSCVQAPRLQAVHLDGTREEGYAERDGDEDVPRVVVNALREFGTAVKRLVIKELPLGDGLRWILSGGMGVEEFVIKHLEAEAELMEGELARFGRKGGAKLRKLGIHQMLGLSEKTILSVARKALKGLEGEAFVIEFMENYGPSSACVRKLSEMGVEVVRWVGDVEDWWTWHL